MPSLTIPTGWIKVGVTEKNDEQRCRDSINHCVRQHRLPDDGWEFVGFVLTYKARELQTRIHRNLKEFRVTREGKCTELFKCSVVVYLITLNGLNEFIDQSQSLRERAALAALGGAVVRRHAGPNSAILG